MRVPILGFHDLVNVACMDVVVCIPWLHKLEWTGQIGLGLWLW